MAVVSTLTIDLVTNTAKFVSGLNKARKRSKSFAKTISLGFTQAAVAAGVLTTALNVLVSSSRRQVDQQVKMASRLGLTQAALAGLTLAAEQTGITQQNLQLALQRSTRRIAEAAQGTGEAVKALDELGVSAKELSQLTPDKQFIALAKAFENVTSQSDKVRLGFKLFDSEGVGLVNTLKLGAKGIQEMADRAKELGIVMTDNQTKAIADSSDAINIMTTSFQGLGNQLAAAFAPSVVRSSQAITNMTTRVTDSIPQWAAWLSSILGVQRALNAMTKTDLFAEIAQLNKDIGKLVDNRDAQEELFRKFGAPAGQAKQDERIAILNDQINLLAERGVEANRILDELFKFGEVADVGTGGDGSGDSGVSKFGTALERSAAATKARFELTNRELQKNFAEFDKWSAQVQAAFNATATPAEQLEQRIIAIGEKLRDNPFFSAELAQRSSQAAVDEYLEQLKRLEDGADDIFENMTEFSKQAFSNMQDILADFLFDPFADGLDGMLKGFITMLRRMVANLLAQKLLTSFFAAFGPATPIPSGGAGGTARSFRSGGNAIGGSATRGLTTTVGEHGPELFTPGASGSIRPLGSVSFAPVTTIGGGGGDGLNIATLIPILEENNKMLMADFIDKFDRGAFN